MFAFNLTPYTITCAVDTDRENLRLTLMSERYCSLGYDAVWSGGNVTITFQSGLLSVSPDYEGSRFLWIIDKFVPDYTASHPKFFFLKRSNLITQKWISHLSNPRGVSVLLEFVQNCSSMTVRRLLSVSPDYEGSRFLWSIDKFVPDYTASHPKFFFKEE